MSEYLTDWSFDCKQQDLCGTSGETKILIHISLWASTHACCPFHRLQTAISAGRFITLSGITSGSASRFISVAVKSVADSQKTQTVYHQQQQQQQQQWPRGFSYRVLLTWFYSCFYYIFMKCLILISRTEGLLRPMASTARPIYWTNSRLCCRHLENQVITRW